MQRYRTLIALVVTGLALAVAPALAFAGVNQFVDTWTDEPTHFFSPNACVEHQAVGDGVESGTAWITETANGTVHVRVRSTARSPCTTRTDRRGIRSPAPTSVPGPTTAGSAKRRCRTKPGR
jgi:hypothetical protein